MRHVGCDKYNAYCLDDPPAEVDEVDSVSASPMTTSSRSFLCRTWRFHLCAEAYMQEGS